MAPEEGHQYIEPMPSTPIHRSSSADRQASPLPLLKPHTGLWGGLLQHLPTQCILCRQWQKRLICTACRTHWMPPVVRCPRCAITLGAHGEAAALHCPHCPHCEDETPDFDRAVAAMDYVAPWSPLLARLKFQGGTALAAPLGDLLAKAAAPRRGRVSLVLPIPLSKQRQQERGFNQSWLLAQRVAGRLGLPARYDLLVRRRHTSRLMTLSADQRRNEIEEAFQATALGRDWLRGQHVALVDDVMTTGATLNAATRALLDAGARSVSAWVVARTPAPSKDDKAPAA